LKNLRRNFERFCLKHRNKGIPNLMLYISIGMLIVYLISYTYMDPGFMLYRALMFDHGAILHGQIWRLVTYVLLPTSSSPIFLVISMFFYYTLGKAVESTWGTLRFNLFYFCGLIITDIAALLMGVNADATYLNLSIVLAFATLYPENHVLLFFIIPLKMKWLAWIYFAFTIFEIAMPPFYLTNLFPVFALLNYFLFFGTDVLDILPDFMKPKGRPYKERTSYSRARKEKPNVNWARDYQKKATVPLYRHKCTVCGRTDTQNPDLEFRYCSKCNGYYCYCMDHINDHAHIT